MCGDPPVWPTAWRPPFTSEGLGLDFGRTIQCQPRLKYELTS